MLFIFTLVTTTTVQSMQVFVSFIFFFLGGEGVVFVLNQLLYGIQNFTRFLDTFLLPRYVLLILL